VREELVDLPLERGFLFGKVGGGGDHLFGRVAGVARGFEQPHQTRRKLLGLLGGVAAGARADLVMRAMVLSTLSIAATAWSVAPCTA